MRGLLVIVIVAVVTLGAGAARTATPVPLHRGCPPGNQRTPLLRSAFPAALAQAKREIYGQRFNIQGQAFVTSARNTSLVAAMRVQKLSLVPGMRALYKQMRTRCEVHTPHIAWAFIFHSDFNIVPDYAPVFIVRTKESWFVF